MSDGIKRFADFSPCRTWRYTLIRTWDDSLPRLLFILLNPSTADAKHDDPTNRRGISFAKRWSYGSVVFVNLFAFRTPYPKELRLADDPVGPDNDQHILQQVELSDLVVAAWGLHGTYCKRDKAVRKLIGRHIFCLGHTKDGHPKHPLYVRSDASLISYGLRSKATA